MISKACVKCNKPMNGGVYRKPNQCPHCFELQDETRTADNKLIKTEAVAKTSLEVVVDNNVAFQQPSPIVAELSPDQDFPIVDATDVVSAEAEVAAELTEAEEAPQVEVAELTDTGSMKAVEDDEKIFDDSTDESIVEALEDEEEQPEFFENYESRPDEDESLDVSLKIEPQVSEMKVEDLVVETAESEMEDDVNIADLIDLEIDAEPEHSENEQKVIAKIKDEVLELQQALKEEPEYTEEVSAKSEENVVELADYAKSEEVQTDEDVAEEMAEESSEEVVALEDQVAANDSGIEERADAVVAELKSSEQVEKVIQQTVEVEAEDLGEVALLEDVVVDVATTEKLVVNGGKIASVERIAEIVKQSEIETAKKAVEIAIAKMSSSVDMSDEVADKVAERVVSKVTEKVADKVAEKVVSNIEAEKSEEELQEKQDRLGNDTRYEAIVLTTESAAALDVEKRLDMVTAEFVFDTNMVKSDVAAVKNFSGSAQSILKDARKTVLDEIKKEAYLLGANTVVDVNLEYSEISGGESAMMLVIATGTAVKTKQAA